MQCSHCYPDAQNYGGFLQNYSMYNANSNQLQPDVSATTLPGFHHTNSVSNPNDNFYWHYSIPGGSSVGNVSNPNKTSDRNFPGIPVQSSVSDKLNLNEEFDGNQNETATLSCLNILANVATDIESEPRSQKQL